MISSRGKRLFALIMKVSQDGTGWSGERYFTGDSLAFTSDLLAFTCGLLVGYQ